MRWMGCEGCGFDAEWEEGDFEECAHIGWLRGTDFWAEDVTVNCWMASGALRVVEEEES